jgi:hypothetical protein
MSAAEFDPVFQSAGAQYGVDPQILKAIAQQESGFNPKAVNPETGAAGIMQYIPASAKALGLDPMDPVASINNAAKDFAGNMQRFNGNVEQAVAAHFAGPDQKQWGPKTSQYVSDVAGKYAAIKQSGGYAPVQGSAPADAAQAGQPDAIDQMLASRAEGKPATAPAQQAGNDADPLDAMLAARAAGQQIPAPAVGGTGAAPAQAAAGQSQGQGQGQWQPPNSFVMGLGDAIKGGVQSMAHGGAWLANKVAPDAQFTKDLNAAVPQIDQTIQNQEQQYTTQRQGNGVDWGRLGGNLVGSAPLAAMAPETAGIGLIGRAAVGAGMGAANSLLTPVTNPDQPYADQKFSQLGTGALVGGAAVPVTGAVGGAISGVTDAARQRLAQAGVTMTPGQMLGGALQRVEDKLTSVPVLGDFIKNAQQRSVQSFNRATYNEALAPIGGTLPRNVPVGSDAVANVRQQIGSVYNSIEPRAQVTADQNLSGDVNAIRANLAQNAPSALQQFDNVVQNQLAGKLQGGTVPQGGGLPIGGVMNGKQWGDARSTIASIARNRITGNSTPDDRVLADALDDLNDAINNAVGRSSPPDILPTLNHANAAYAQYKQIERAAGSAGASNNGNVFTAAQFANAVRSGSTAAQKSTNSGLNGQLAADATNVLGSKYPDSGTVGRSLLTLGLGAAAGHAVAPGVMVPAALGIGIGSLPYTAYGQRLAQALMMNRPALAAPVGNAVSRFGPALGAALAPGVARSQP